MVNSMTSLNFSTREAKFQTHHTFSWATLSTEDTTQLKHLNFSWPIKSDTPEELLSLEETMKADKSPQSMGSMMKLSENMETPIHGNTALKFLTTLVLPLLSRVRSFASMEDYHLKSKLSIRLELFKDAKRFLMRVLSVI